MLQKLASKVKKLVSLPSFLVIHNLADIYTNTFASQLKITPSYSPLIKQIWHIRRLAKVNLWGGLAYPQNKYKSMKVEMIVNRRAWFRSIRPGDVSEGKFKDYRALKSISVQLTDYNASEGKRNGVFVHASYDRDELIVYLVGVSQEQRAEELSDPCFKDEWKKKVDEWKRDRRR